ncbi:MAG: hypothetical protein ACI8TQ_001520 [Planctomycetota bacterium]|jgi:hypothetical protein
MPNSQPSIPELIESLPYGVEGGVDESPPSKKQIQSMLADMQSQSIPTGRVRRM